MLKILDKMSDEEKVSDDADTTKSEIRKPHDINGSTTLYPASIETSLRTTMQEINVSEVNTKIKAGNSVKISNMQLGGTQVISVPQAANQDAAGNQIVHDVKNAEDHSTYTSWDYSCCDGPCLRSYDDSDKMIHVCMCCYDTTYCETCFNKYVIAGSLPYKKVTDPTICRCHRSTKRPRRYDSGHRRQHPRQGRTAG
jgi:hypothetical protein